MGWRGLINLAGSNPALATESPGHQGFSASWLNDGQPANKLSDSILMPSVGALTQAERHSSRGRLFHSSIPARVSVTLTSGGAVAYALSGAEGYEPLTC